MNTVILIGRLTREPDMRTNRTGKLVTNLTLTVGKELTEQQKQKAIDEGKPTADFINVMVFGKQAENCAKYLTKGSKIMTYGRITTGIYERYIISADKVQFLEKINTESKAKVSIELPGKPRYFFDFNELERDYEIEEQLEQGETIFEDSTCGDCVHYDSELGICILTDEIRNKTDNNTCDEFEEEF